jgi:hypothetical protein
MLVILSLWHKLNSRQFIKHISMKPLLLIPLLLMSLCANARKILVDKGVVTTTTGIGGYAQTGYAFAKGDVITVTANAQKHLQRMIVILHPNTEIGRQLDTKNPNYTFTMPEDGMVVIRFISDRAGTNDINYTVMRTPASPALENYDTRVIWEKPDVVAPGYLIPRRATQ